MKARARLTLCDAQRIHNRGVRLLGLLLAGLPAAAGAAPALTPGQAAMSGYWHNVLPPGVPFAPTPPDIYAKMRPSTAAKFAKDQAALAAGQFVSDPNTECMPAAIGGTGSSGGLAYSEEVLVEPRQVSFLYELNRGMRFAYVGKQHPAKLAPRWQGDSIAHWEGDTLVVDTIGFNDKNMLMLGSNLKLLSTDNVAMSSKMHVVEHYRILPNGELEDIAVFADPGAFTAPFTLTTHFVRTGPFQEYICAENNHEGGVPTSTGGTTAFDLPTTP
jgi:hypothetical protein